MNGAITFGTRFRAHGKSLVQHFQVPHSLARPCFYQLKAQKVQYYSSSSSSSSHATFMSSGAKKEWRHPPGHAQEDARTACERERTPNVIHTCVTCMMRMTATHPVGQALAAQTVPGGRQQVPVLRCSACQDTEYVLHAHAKLALHLAIWRWLSK